MGIEVETHRNKPSREPQKQRDVALWSSVGGHRVVGSGNLSEVEDKTRRERYGWLKGQRVENAKNGKTDLFAESPAVALVQIDVVDTSRVRVVVVRWKSFRVIAKCVSTKPKQKADRVERRAERLRLVGGEG
ncbi:uncharacterized protein ColSpa_05868 [Colletotrichum spaethianum]|uniref:Uncharacterized protein n=1 Tax=Colletotrichum spaethianum TaxID=700344 RepID=A0AA37LK38_9PEZI|nr:uncharacterized protein ColSpa_05868 [Colletotrichum spaethianum]GKT45687.1 hypothetical protein ColSpa_05868 [Colletotrichum spaethianum]